ncbi:MarR family winged helix-turn-helix transcriptional regulator [Tsukamurella spumae]|uniref:Winged helix DNA-binding protein n=1 Tax=Tsukamurella spumae TaxID=44753 RepID=A0A846X5P7_9ACTN|nr:MarR family transcriptional regulator [Tsukamurella spumae]NKY20828.1 winged helix DNA-binding protein [Tsukamurella spumae]
MSDAPPSGPDLAALLARLFPRLMTLEEPILADAGVTMWEYAILSELVSDTALSQVELSRRTGRDTTRLGKHLTALESRGLLSRDRAPDGRQRTVGLTDAGRAAQSGAKRAIRAAEDSLLSESLSPAESAELRRLLTELGR